MTLSAVVDASSSLIVTSVSTTFSWLGWKAMNFFKNLSFILRLKESAHPNQIKINLVEQLFDGEFNRNSLSNV